MSGPNANLRINDQQAKQIAAEVTVNIGFLAFGLVTFYFLWPFFLVFAVGGWIVKNPVKAVFVSLILANIFLR